MASNSVTPGRNGARRLTLAWIVAAFVLAVFAGPVRALDAIPVPVDVQALDLTLAIDRYLNVGDRLQVSTAPDADGIVRRIEVRSRQADNAPAWAVFALVNNSDEQIDRLLVAPHFRLAGSRILRPDLGASRIVGVTPSQGLAPVREPIHDADVYRITLDPGAIVTLVVELRTPDLPQLYLWDVNAFRDHQNATTLFEGIVLGTAGILTLVLTILFVVKRSAMFPAVALFSWSVLAYLTIEFGFWSQLFDLGVADERLPRAIVEALLPGTLIIFLFAYLNLNHWHSRFSYGTLAFLGAIAATVGIAFYDPQLASGIGRMTLGLVGIVGFAVILWLSVRGFDRAILLIPAWLVLILWLLGAWLGVSGRLVNDFVSPALSGGMVLIVLLLGFTVMQHAFAGGALAEGIMNDTERKVLALAGAGDHIWDWEVARNHVVTSDVAAEELGLKPGALEGAIGDWLDVIHVQDRDTFKLALDTVVERGRGRINLAFRMRGDDGHFRWARLRARPIVGSDGEVMRCVGTIRDITEVKTSEERLLHDAVHDNLTGLANRALFLDRLDSALSRAHLEKVAKPSVIVINIDNFRTINAELGVSVGDSVLLTVARRLSRGLKANDSIARISGDEFAILLLSEQEPARIAAFAESLRRALKPPIIFNEREMRLTVSIGVATYDPQCEGAEEALKDAEVAVVHAKRLGGNRCEAFRPLLREHGRSLVAVESDLRRALEREELVVLFQPIVSLPERRLAGFEALLRWDHPRRGRMGPDEFVPIAERSGLIIPVGLYVMERAARELAGFASTSGAADDLFVSINISSRQLLRHDLINDLRALLSRTGLKPGALKLEVTESLVMENPEYCAQVLERVRALGIGLSMDDFGTGHSSLSYLERFPFDTIKIDQSFVKGGAGSEKRPLILRSIVTLAHDLGMAVVAEGVETEDSVEELVALDCEFAQGFVFGKPVTAVEARQLVGNARLLVAE
ncbi:MAG: sensor domain-containing phosphodiesterase [Hyphomicrobiaceae bacterium]|nr:sensor domain-containing phosphodiesterase [Hyphomicrobiaceae bacterium]